MRSKEHGRKFPWWIVAAVAVIGLIVYEVIPKPLEIKAAKVTRGVLELSLSSTGIVEGEVSDVSPMTTARITHLYAEEGQAVSKGEVLAQLESCDLRAQVERAQAAVRAAEQQVRALRTSAIAQTGQLQAALQRARATLKVARDKLRDLESGSREEDIESQRAMVAQAKAKADDARKRYERAEQLLKDGAISQQDLDSAKASYDAAEAVLDSQEQILLRLEAGPREETVQAARDEVRAAEAAVHEAEASLGFGVAKKGEVAAAEARLAESRAALKNANVQLGYATISSPVSGVVARKHREVGETVTPLDAIYTVANLDRIWVTAEVDEEDAAAVALGQKVKITLDAYPGREAWGTVVHVSHVAEPKEVGRVRAKIVRAKVVLERSPIPLRPGMEVNVTGFVPAGTSTLLVPNDAVVRLGDKDTVYVINDGVTKPVEVATGQSNFDSTQILSGLRKGDLVAITNLGELADGTKVRVVHDK